MVSYLYTKKSFIILNVIPHMTSLATEENNSLSSRFGIFNIWQWYPHIVFTSLSVKRFILPSIRPFLENP